MPITLTARPSQHHKETVILVNVGSGNGFVLHDTRLLPRPVLINYQWGLVTSQEMLEKSLLDMNAKITHFRQSHLLRHKWVNTILVCVVDVASIVAANILVPMPSSITPWWRHHMETVSSLMALMWGESIGDQWIPLTRASGAKLYCFLWYTPKQTAEQTIIIMSL